MINRNYEQRLFLFVLVSFCDDALYAPHADKNETNQQMNKCARITKIINKRWDLHYDDRIPRFSFPTRNCPLRILLRLLRVPADDRNPDRIYCNKLQNCQVLVVFCCFYCWIRCGPEMIHSIQQRWLLSFSPVSLPLLLSACSQERSEPEPPHPPSPLCEPHTESAVADHHHELNLMPLPRN